MTSHKAFEPTVNIKRTAIAKQKSCRSGRRELLLPFSHEPPLNRQGFPASAAYPRFTRAVSRERANKAKVVMPKTEQASVARVLHRAYAARNRVASDIVNVPYPMFQGAPPSAALARSPSDNQKPFFEEEKPLRNANLLRSSHHNPAHSLVCAKLSLYLNLLDKYAANTAESNQTQQPNSALSRHGIIF